MSANFAGAFLGIVVTFGTTAVIDMHARKSMARRAELIAIAHIDNDIMQLEAICEEMQETDSLYRFVYERHPDRLAEISRDTIDLLLIAVRPDYQKKGVNAMILYHAMLGCFKLGIKEAETGPMLETNEKVQSQWKDFDIEQHKRRRCFIKDLDHGINAANAAAAAQAEAPEAAPAAESAE